MKHQLIIIAVFICCTALSWADQANQEELMSMLEEHTFLTAGDSNSLRVDIDVPAMDFQRLRQKLVYGQMQPLREQTAQEQQAGLNQLIEQLRSLDLPPQPMEQPVDDVESEDTQEKDMTESFESAKEVDLVLPVGDEEKDVLGRIEKITQAAYPLALADTLFRKGHFAEAIKYYQAADEKVEKDDVISQQWILFQRANCLRGTEAGRAAELYGEFIEKYPNSVWSPVAAARKATIEWNQKIQIQGKLNNHANASE